MALANEALVKKRRRRGEFLRAGRRAPVPRRVFCQEGDEGDQDSAPLVVSLWDWGLGT